MTPCSTMYMTSHSTLHMTPLSTLHDIPFHSAYDTPFHSAYDIPFHSAYDTPFHSAYDTLFHSAYDTLFHSAYDIPFHYVYKAPLGFAYVGNASVGLSCSAYISLLGYVYICRQQGLDFMHLNIGFCWLSGFILHIYVTNLILYIEPLHLLLFLFTVSKYYSSRRLFPATQKFKPNFCYCPMTVPLLGVWTMGNTVY